MGAINPHLLSQCYLIDVTTRTFNVVGRTFDYIFSPLCATTGKKRVDAIARLLSAIARFYPLPENFIPSWYAMRHSLVMRRLQDGPDPSWDQVDRKLCELCRDLIPSCIPIVHVASVVESIRACILEPNAGNLRVCAPVSHSCGFC